MKILFITSFYAKKADSASIQNSGLINGFTEAGNEVDVLTVNWDLSLRDNFIESCTSYNKLYRDDFYILSKLKWKNKVGNTPTKLDILKSQIKEVIKDLYFFPHMDKDWINNYNTELDYDSYDLMVTSSDSKTAHFVAAKIRKNHPNLTWYQVWGDPWAADVGISGFSKYRANRAEKKLLGLADKIFYVSIPTMEYMKKNNPEHADIMHYIPRGYLNEVISDRDSSKVDEYILTYTGVLGAGRDISKLLKGIDEYNKTSTNKKIKFQVYGICDEKDRTEMAKYSFAYYGGIVEYKDIIGIYQNTDALLFVSNKAGATQIPGKIFDYFGTNRSVLAIMEDSTDDVSKFLRDSNRAFVVGNNPTEIKEVLIDLVNDKKREPLREYGNLSVAKMLLDEYKK